MDEKARRDLRNIIAFAVADGNLNEGEKQFIERARRRLGVGDAEFRDIVQQVRINPGRVSLPTDPRQAAEAVRLLAETARADGEVSDVERGMLSRLARRAGLPQPPAPAGAKAAADLDAAVEALYAGFAGWDAETRRGQVARIAAAGRDAVVPLLRVLESYRVPEGSSDALVLKTVVAEQLGRLGDERAAYYLAQQVELADVEEEVSSSALREAAAAALGRIVGERFPPGPAGVEAARKWWFNKGLQQYSRLAY